MATATLSAPNTPHASTDHAPKDIVEDYLIVHEKLSKHLRAELRQAVKGLTAQDIRLMIDLYYQVQQGRIRLANQTRIAPNTDVPLNAFLGFFFKSFVGLETYFTSAMEEHAKQQRPGRWLLAQYGIGPVLAAGLLAHLLPGGVPHTAGHWEVFAGIKPNMHWWSAAKAADMVESYFGKGRLTELTFDEVATFAPTVDRKATTLYTFASKDRTGTPQKVTRATLARALARRPWNAALKVLLWKCAVSWVKFHGRDECFYGKLWEQRKAQEIAKNAAGEFAEQAALALQAKRYGQDTVARKHYEQGQLPPAHLEARAKRWVERIFLSHLHHVCHVCEHGTLPPKPYVIQYLGHTDIIEVPHWPID